MTWKLYAGFLLLILAGCAIYRPAPPRDLPWDRDYPDRPEALPELSASLRLDDVLVHAFARNPGLAAARELWHAAQARPAQHRSLPDPKLTVQHFLREVETRNGPIENGITFSQNFPFFGKLSARSAVAEAQAMAAWERYAADGLRVTEAVKRAYFELGWVRGAVKITTENRTLLERHLKIAQTRYEAGRATQQDVLKAQVELSRLENDLVTLEELEGTAAAKLNTILDRPPQAQLGSTSVPDIEGLKQEADALYQLALNESPRLRELDHRLAAARAAAHRADLAWYPDFVAGVQYQQVGGTSLPGAPDPGEDAYGITFGITLPIWSGKYRAAEEEAEARIRAAEHQIREEKNMTRFSVKELHYKVRTAERLVALYRDEILPRQDKVLRSAEADYQAGRAEFINLIDAQRSLLAFRLAHERARTDFQQRLAELERIVGMRLTKE